MNFTFHTSSAKVTKPGFVRSILELLGVVFFRFRPVPRVWGWWLVAVNSASLAFISTIEAQAVLIVTVVAVVLQSLAYQRIGFTRILGITHYAWIPMFAWLGTRLDHILLNQPLTIWLAVLLATNTVSLVIDTMDVARFLRGERQPHYHWAKSETT
jgi:CBS domain containing-hemolysin-like protein